jgi:AraC-like DNA-binding protein
MPELTVAAGLARGLMDLAVSKGASEAELAARSGISAQDMQDVDNRIPFARYVALMRAGKELANDPALALHYGETNDMAQISIVGLIAYACETMLEAMVQVNRYARLVVEFDGPRDRWSVVSKNGGMWAVDNRENPNAFPELTESSLARMICGPRRFGVTQIAKAVHVTHPAPAYRAEYDRIYGTPVTFDADWNAVQLDEKWMTHKIAVQPHYVFGILSEHADALLKSLENSKSTRGRVESLLMPILHKGEASMDAIAEKMGLSRQTLFRQLKAEGTNFETVLDALRHQLALQYLRGRKASVNETAYLVGFSEPAAFSRAFKRWTGMNPREMRHDADAARQ